MEKLDHTKSSNVMAENEKKISKIVIQWGLEIKFKKARKFNESLKLVSWLSDKYYFFLHVFIDAIYIFPLNSFFEYFPIWSTVR